MQSKTVPFTEGPNSALVSQLPIRKRTRATTDDELLTLTLEVQANNIPSNHFTFQRPPRKQFHAYKLKDNKVKKTFRKALESLSGNTLKEMQNQKNLYDLVQINKQTLPDCIHNLFASNICKQAKTILGEVDTHYAPLDKPRQTKDSTLRNTNEQSKLLHDNIVKALHDTQAAINNGAPQADIDRHYEKLHQERTKYKLHHSNHQDRQLFQYISDSTLNFFPTGPTINDVLFCLQQTASNIRRRADQLLAFICTNKNYKSDPATWKPTTTTAKTAAQSALGWSQFSFSIGHSKRHHRLSPFSESEADRVEQQVRTLNQLPQPTRSDFIEPSPFPRRPYHTPRN
jgi:hypothetical protein